VCRLKHVELLDALLFRQDGEDSRKHLAKAAQSPIGINLSNLAAKALTDGDVVGGLYSTACYITESWPSVLYLTFKYVESQKAAFVANANLGGDNAHRGAVPK